MKETLVILQFVFAILLSLAILAQSKGVGLSETFGGQSASFATSRGIDKFLHVLTILLAIGLVVNTLAFAFVSTV